MAHSANPNPRAKKPAVNLKKRLIMAAFLAAAVAGAWWWMGAAGDDTRAAATFQAFRGPMEITVLESGSIEAQESVEIQSEVEGQTKILSIIEEGYYITADDVAEKKVLVELDATELEKRKTQQELEYQNALAAYTEARESYAIQLNQNSSDIRAAELEAKFARMDFEKYMGARAANEIIALMDIEIETAAPEALPQPGDLTFDEMPLEDRDTLLEELAQEEAARVRPEINFATYAAPEILEDGEAGQRLRALEDALVLARQEVGLAETQLEGTKRLFEKEFVTKNDLDNDEMRLRRNQINMESSATAKDLHIRYEFPKQAEKLLSDYEEALRKLERAEKLAVSRLAQAEAKLNSTEARYDLQRGQLEDVLEQIEKCIIVAATPGLVVFGTGNERPWDNERVEEGASVRERQVIITIPNTTAMAVNVKVHESYVQQVQRGQKARVRIDAERGQLLTGLVTKIAVLPDSQNRWMNPDLKVYETQIALDQTPAWLKPGMSAEVEIVVSSLDDAVQVPLQAVRGQSGARVVHVAGTLGPETRPVKTGAYNDSYIQVLEGLDAGENVLLLAPAGDEPEEKKDKPGKQEGEEEGEDGDTQVAETDAERGA
jgi:HlyD family secretion protein